MNKILPIIITAVASSAMAATHQEPTHSALSEGHWVKFRVDSAAVYAFTYDELREMGFQDPSKVHAFGYKPTLLLTHNPSVIPADLQPMASVYRGNKLVFYAPSNVDHGKDIWYSDTAKDKYIHPKEAEHKRHMFSNGATYFLSDAECTPLQPAQTAAPETADNATMTHTSLIFHERDLTTTAYCGSHITGEAIKSKDGSLTFPFTLSKVADGGKALLITYTDHFGGSMQGHTLAVTYPQGFLSDNPVPEKPLDLSNFQAYSSMRTMQAVTVPVTDTKQSYELKFTVNPSAVAFTKTHIDFWALRYERNNDLSGEAQMRMFFRSDASKSVALTGITDPTPWVVWDVTDPIAPVECTLRYDSGKTLFSLPAIPDDISAREVVAFNPSASFPRPHVIGAVANQDLHALPTPQMLIIAPALLLDRAERFAQLHRNLQGLDVAVVDQQKIFNEYGSGNISPEAVRRFATHLDEKTPGTLRSILLMGAATANNANDIADDKPYAVTSLNEDQEECRKATRGFFADAFFGNTKPLATGASWTARPTYYCAVGFQRTVNVGRLPFTNLADFDRYYDKAERYLTCPPTNASPGSFILASDFCGDKSKEMHYNDAETSFSSYNGNYDYTLVRAAPNFYAWNNVTKVRRISDAAIQQGAGLFVYYGHGARESIGGSTGQTYLDINDALGMHNPLSMPHAFIGSCNTGAMDVDPNNITTSMLTAANGGMISVVSSSREVFQSHNRTLGTAFVKQYKNSDDGTPIGTIHRLAQNEALKISEAIRDGIVNHYCYNLFADPELPIYKETHRIEVTDFNSGSGTINTGGANTLTGHVLSADGRLDKTFQGTVLINIYDPSQTLRRYLNAGARDDVYLTVDHQLLHQVQAPVKNGEFTVKFTSPAPTATATDSNPHRIQLYAHSSDATKRALGSISNLLSAPATQSKSDAPQNSLEIRSLTEAITGNRCTITAEIAAQAGLPLGNPIASAIHFTFDGTAISSAPRTITPAGNGLFTYEYTVDGLLHGRHTARISAIDADGNTVSSEIEFVHAPMAETQIMASVQDGTLQIASEALEAGCSTAVIVETLDGTLVRRIDSATLPLAITGLAKGNYRVYTQHASSSGHTSSAKHTVKI